MPGRSSFCSARPDRGGRLQCVYGSGDYTDAATTIMQYLCLNTRRAPFLTTRRPPGRDLGVDRASCVSAYLLGHGLAAQFPVSPASGLYPRDLEAAYSRMAMPPLWRRGAEHRQDPGLTLLVNQESSFRVSLPQTIAAGLSRYDLQVTVRSLPYDGEYVQALEQGDFDLCLCQVKLTADWDLRPLLQSYAAMNYGGFADPGRRTPCWRPRCAAEAGERSAAMTAPCEKAPGPGPPWCRCASRAIPCSCPAGAASSPISPPPPTRFTAFPIGSSI